MKRTQLAQKLLLQGKPKTKHTYLIGFDGFIDEIVTPIKKRFTINEIEPITTIHDFAKRIIEAEGKGTNIELKVQKQKIGGNGPILAEGLTSLGSNVHLIGALGSPTINPLFTPLRKRCSKVFSIAEPSHTDALEFQDGKILLGKHQSVLDINFSLLEEKIGRKAFVKLFETADTFVSVNWTMIMQMTEIWKCLLNDVFPMLLPKTKKRQMFVDLADPAKRTNDDILAALDILSQMQPYYDVTLGLNQLEAMRLHSLFNPTIKIETSRDAIISMTAQLQEKSKLHAVIIHATKFAAGYSAQDSAIVDGPYVTTPRLTTGAGDHFNAGYLFGKELGFSLEEALLLGVTTSGFYVRYGTSPTQQELITFLRVWEQNPETLDSLF